jgi:cytochrome c
MKHGTITVALLVISFTLGISTAAAAVDAEAALSLSKSNGCLKCHAVDRDKKGPSYKKIAEKYKGKADAENTLIKNITTGPKVKFDDGTEDRHKIIDTKEQDKLKNLVSWILER